MIRQPRNKDCPVAILFAKIAIQDAFFHGFMDKRMMRLNAGSTGYCP
ncbi:hypothetical protein H3T59_03830 [Commensalibacter sp. M0357]|nr:hypothetical protein [Commensalibacter sp. M0357]MBI0084598.1 hypothetical protein [Commensalibacter sp. M0355]